MSETADEPTRPVVDEPPPPGARVERVLAGACMALLCIITLANVLVRYFTSFSFAFTEEVSVFLLVVMTLVGAAGAFATGSQIRISALTDRLPGPLATGCHVLAWAAAVAAFLLLAWLAAHNAWDEYRFGVTSPALGVPQWWYSVWLPVLAATIVLRLVWTGMRAVMGRMQ